MKQREGVLVEPYERISQDEVARIDKASMEILYDPGLFSDNEEVVEILGARGAKIKKEGSSWRIRIPEKIIRESIEGAPSIVTLGARKVENRIVLNSDEPRVRFGTGAETNIWLEIDFEPFLRKSSPSEERIFPVFKRRSGTLYDLCQAARLSEQLKNLDFFIRPVNIQDNDITKENNDVNKFFASLNNTTKHVMAGLTSINQLKNVSRMGEIIVGGKEELRKNPIISFITCCVKSPLQFIGSISEEVIKIAKTELPLVISGSPMGGTTAPFSEFGMVSQINAEILAGITLHQSVNPGAPVLYGSVPTRVRLDNLNDMYGAPEFNHYNIDCVQMARFYHIPCYSTAGVGDTIIPGIQATTEKLPSQLLMAMAGAQYIHYAFGLLERTNTFCPEQAILDDVQIGLIKFIVEKSKMGEEEKKEALKTIRDVMKTKEKMFIYHLPLPTKENVYIKYPLDSEVFAGELYQAHKRKKELLEMAPAYLSKEIVEKIFRSVPGILNRLNPYYKRLKGEE